jgi:hypothetical protein
MPLPQPPEIQRRVVFSLEIVAVTVLVLALPAAALAGTFRAYDTARTETESLSVAVAYPTRALFHEHETVHVDVFAKRDCASVRVELDASYLERFEQHSGRVDEALAVFGPLRAGDARSLRLGLEPDQPLAAQGMLTARCDDRAPTKVALSTFVFP